MQPQASKDKYNPPPQPATGDTIGTLSFAQPVTHTLPPRTVDPAMSGFPQPGSLCSPGLLQGREGPRRPAQVDPRSALGVPLASPLVPSTHAARGPASPYASVRNSPARPFSTRPHEAALVASALPKLLVRTLPPTDAENGF